jgi:putative AlgH/UPF0301 family transcriptional regulator
MTPLDPSQWAYESGKVVEQGTVILGGVEQDFGFGLRQQYFHKAAILILDHQETKFTKGIILNRPTDLELEDDLNPGLKWKVWFGGDVQGLKSEKPDIVCLHSLQSREATKASIPIMNDIQWTTFKNAKRLVKAGVAVPADFQVFCGYAGWAPGVLVEELDRKSWYTVATNSQTLLKELSQTASSDPRDAGLETWYMLMNMIGREELARENEGGFDDLMLKEWSLGNLLSNAGGGGAGEKKFAYADDHTGSTSSSALVEPSDKVLRKDSVDQMMDRASSAAQAHDVLVGHLVRAAPVDRSPFLLHDQELHKSIILVLMDDDLLTIGAILNRPAAKGLDLHVAPKIGGLCAKQTITLPLRFGGQYTMKNEEPLLWVHCSKKLRSAKIGAPVGPANSGIWKCSVEEVTSALSRGLATTNDFLVVTGVSAWTKDGPTGGIQGEIEAGNFEIVPISKTRDVWDSLSKQQVLTGSTLKHNLAMADEAWSKCYWSSSDTLPLIDKRAGNKNQKDPLVFKSNVKVASLADEALMHWVATFLLGVPVAT